MESVLVSNMSRKFFWTVVGDVVVVCDDSDDCDANPSVNGCLYGRMSSDDDDDDDDDVASYVVDVVVSVASVSYPDVLSESLVSKNRLYMSEKKR